MKSPPSPLEAPSDLQAQRAAAGWAVLDAAAMIRLCGLPATALGGLQSVQQGLPLDSRQPAWHDALVLTCRRGGFRGPYTAPGAGHRYHHRTGSLSR